jgi:ADP-ribose pyrophosphatase YjhB (NUDIX family)
MAVISRPRDGALLVSVHAGVDPFHRPLGGHVEFGEYALDTINREFLEEIDQRLTEVRLLGVLENIFEWQGEPQHEVVFLFRAGFADPAAYEIPEQAILDEADGRSRVIWRSPGATSPPLYPNGVTELIATSELSRRETTPLIIVGFARHRTRLGAIGQVIGICPAWSSR